MTQEELANRIGITPQALSKWERNQSLPDVSLLISLCNVLDVSTDCLPPLELIFSVSLVPALFDNYVKDIENVRTRLAGEPEMADNFRDILKKRYGLLLRLYN